MRTAFFHQFGPRKARWPRAFLIASLLAVGVFASLGPAAHGVAARELVADQEYVRLEKLVRDTPVERMNEAWLIDQVYGAFKSPQPYLKQILGDSSLQAKNGHMARLRQAIDLKFWSRVAKEKGWVIELTNQGKSKGHRSDLDQTGWIVAGPEANRPANFEEVQGLWEKHFDAIGIDPSKPDMTIFNGDQFMPDWANAKTGTSEFVISLADNVLQLRQNAEAYYVPGANKEQVHTRALAEGRTMHIVWDYDLDMPVVNGRPLDLDAFVRGDEVIHYLRTEDIAVRYHGVNAAKPWRNALGNLAQNLRNYLTHLNDPLARQKYGNRVLDGAFARILGVTQRGAKGDIKEYYSVHNGEGSPAAKRAFKEHFIRQMYGGDNPEGMSRNRVDELIQIYDVSVQVETDKGANQDYSPEKYYAPWLQEAAAELRRSNPELRGAELRRQSWAKAEQIYIQKQLSAIVDGASHVLKHALDNDMTEAGRNRHRADYGNDTAVHEQNVRKVLAERQVEIALLFEVVEQIQDPSMRKKLRNDLLDAAPEPKLRQMLQDLSDLAQAGRQAVDDWLLASKKRGKLAPPEEFYRKISGDVEKIIRAKVDDAAELTTRERAKQWMRQKALLLLGPLEGERLNKAAEFAAEAGNQVGAFKDWYWQEFLSGFNFFFYANTATGLLKAYEDQCLKRGVGGTACSSAVAWQAAKDFAWGLPVMDSYGSAIFAVMQINRGDPSGFLTLPLVLAPRVGVGAGALHIYAVYKLTEGVYDVTYGYVMYTIEEDILDQALKALPEPGKNARRCGERRGVGGGETPQFPLFFKEIDVPANNWDNNKRLAEAERQFAVPINHELIREGFDPKSPNWQAERGKRIHKYACLLPYFQRIGKIYTHFRPEVERYIESAQNRGREDFEDLSHPYMASCVTREREDREKKRKAAEGKGKDALRDYDAAAAKLPSPIATCLPRGLEKVSPIVKAFFTKKIADWLGSQPQFYQDAFSTTVEQTTEGVPVAEDLRRAYEWAGSYLGWDTRPLRKRLLQKLSDTLIREYVLNQYLYHEREEANWELNQRIRGAAAMVSRAEKLMRAIQTGNTQISKQVVGAVAESAARNFTKPVQTVKPMIKLNLPKHPLRLGQDALVDASIRGEYYAGGMTGPSNDWKINLKTMPLDSVKEGAPDGLIVTEKLAKQMKNKKNAIFSIRQTVVADLVDGHGRVLGSETGEIIWYDVRLKLDREDEEDQPDRTDQTDTEAPSVDLSGILSRMREAEVGATTATGQARAACTAAENMIADVERGLPAMEAKLQTLQATLNLWRPAMAQFNALGDKADQLAGDAKKAATRAREYQQLADRTALAACERLREINDASEPQRAQILNAVKAAVQACKSHARTVGQAAQDAKGAAAACSALMGALTSLKPAKPLPATEASELKTAATDSKGKLDAANATRNAASGRIGVANGSKGSAAELNAEAKTKVAGLTIEPEVAAQLAEMNAIISNIDQLIGKVENCPEDVAAALETAAGRQDALRANVNATTNEIARFDTMLKNDSHRLRVQEGIDQSGNYAEIADWSLRGMQKILISVATCQATAEQLIRQAAERDRRHAEERCSQIRGARAVRHPSGEGWACQCAQPGAKFDQAQNRCNPPKANCAQLENQFFGLLVANRIQEARRVLSQSGHCEFSIGGSSYIQERVCINLAEQFRAAYGAGNWSAAAGILSRARHCGFYASAAAALNQRIQPGRPTPTRPPVTTRRQPTAPPARPPSGGGCTGAGTGVLLLCQEADSVD